jgi:hypothetical protein
MISPESKALQRPWTDGGGVNRCLAAEFKASLKASRNPSQIAEESRMADRDHPDQGAPELQVALVRRAVDHCDAARERCCGCRRTPLIGERIYFGPEGAVYCELCRALDPDPPLESRVVHGPEFGHTMRLRDHRAA